MKGKIAMAYILPHEANLWCCAQCAVDYMLCGGEEW